jgi:hypothetical protein
MIMFMTIIADLVMEGWNRPNLPGLYQKSYPGSGGVTVGNLYTRTRGEIVSGSGRQEKAPLNPYIVVKL